MEDRIKTVTTSQIKTFKKCQKWYDFAYNQMLVPIETPKPLSVGRMYHKGVELIQQGRSLGEIFAAVEAMAAEEAQRAEADVDGFQVVLAQEMIRAFYRDSRWQEWEVRAVEKQFEVSTGYAKRLAGRVDGVISVNGQTLLLENKTVANYGDGSRYANNLLWDEQSTNYLYAYQRMLEDGVIEGSAAVGVYYALMEKCTYEQKLKVAEVKYNKDGSPRKGQQLQDETEEEYRLRVQAWYTEKPRFHTVVIVRKPEEIAEHIAEINKVIKLMSYCERENTWCRNPQACSMFGCPYAPKCLNDSPDTDVLYRKKERKNEELS